MEGCAAPTVCMQLPEAVPVPIHVGHVAPLCSDKALGTQKKSHPVDFRELCFKQSQVKSAENREWPRGCWLIRDYHHLILYSSGQNLSPFLVPRDQNCQGSECQWGPVYLRSLRGEEEKWSFQVTYGSFQRIGSLSSPQ